MSNAPRWSLPSLPPSREASDDGLAWSRHAPWSAPFCENIWLLSYPLTLLGADVHRHVSVIRLASGPLLIHSTGPFTPDDVVAIHALGRPGWLVEAMLRHDTYSREGHTAFPNVPFLAPAGFDAQVPFPVLPLLPPPPAWADEIAVHEIGGVPSFRETVFLHRPSRTLIVADLVMNFPDQGPLWTEFLVRVAVGAQHAPGMSRALRFAIKDEAAFRRSLETILAWDFDRVIPGHGEPIFAGGKEKVAAMLQAAGF